MSCWSWIRLEEENSDECPSCKVAVALGMAINVCKELGDKKECEELFKQVTEEKISPKELFEKVKEKAKNKQDQLEILEYIEGLAGDLEINES